MGRPAAGLLSREFLVYLLRSNSFLAYAEKQSTRTNIPKINRKALLAYRAPLPPLPEQRRIAAILDKADAIRRKRQEAIQLTEQFLRSAFLDMFGDPATNPRRWGTGVLGDVIHAAKDGPHISPEYANQGIPFLSTRHVRPEGVRWEDLKYITIEEAERQWKKCKPERGDVLYTKGGTTGIATPIDFDKQIAVWVHVALLKTNHQRVDAIWLGAMLNTRYCHAQSQRYTHGITNQDLGLTRMVKIKMYLPPLERQHEYNDVANRAKVMRKRLAESAQETDDLFNSLVQRAFRGEL